MSTRTPTNDPQIIGIIFGCIGALILVTVLGSLYVRYSHGYNVCSNRYSKKELFSILAHDPTLGDQVHQVDVGLYRVTGHKFLYPDKVPMDPNFFHGLMTLEQFAHVMVMINTAIIEAHTDGYKSMVESLRTQGYTAAIAACQRATAYLRQNNVRAVVYQTTDHELRKYVNGFYQGTDWDTSIYISFREQDLLDDFQLVLVLRENPNSTATVGAHDPVPMATAVVPFVASEPGTSEFAHITDGSVQKLARDLRVFYNRFDPSRTALQIETAAKWATEHGVPALNDKLREKYGHDLNVVLVHREPPV